jgi:GTP cyclohydrolase II
VTVPLPTPYGVFEARAFECSDGFVYVALVLGEPSADEPVLTRLHSECLTGDVLGSLRCECGVQLRQALRAVAAEGRGVLLYLTGQEGRGIGLVNKLRAYVQQDLGADTLDANVRLGLDPDLRDYREAARVLAALGIRSVRLLSNNPAKVSGLRAHGIDVAEVVPLATAAHARNRGYLDTKHRRFAHARPGGSPLVELPTLPADVGRLVGAVRPATERPYVVVKYAQTIDGRIATHTGDSKWISGESERRISHTMRAACDAVLVGTGTVLTDDPQLTVRLVPGASPLRVVLDSRLRTPLTAKVLSDDAATLLVSTPDAAVDRRDALIEKGAAVRIVPAAAGGVDLLAALAVLRAGGIASLLVEGGSRVVTALLAAGLVDRLVVSISPTVLGAGIDGVGPLGTTRVSDGIRLGNRSVFAADDDVLLGWDVLPRAH